MDEDFRRLHAYVETIVASGETRLPPEPKLADAVDITRGRLRTLLKRMEEDGIIWRHVGKGTFVGPRQINVDDQAWSAAISVDNIMDARMVLEPQLAAQAAIHATPADIGLLNQCVQEMREASSFLQWKRYDDKLHRAIAEATHNVVLLMLYDMLGSQVKLSLHARMEEVYAGISGPRAATDDEHHLFVDAIAEHHPTRAEEAMRDHLRSVRTALFGIR